MSNWDWELESDGDSPGDSPASGHWPWYGGSPVHCKGERGAVCGQEGIMIGNFQTFEEIIFRVSVDSGLPVHYSIDWGPDSGISNSTKDQNVTSGTNETFSYTIPVPGQYLANITAYNLHSEPYGFNKYTHNLTRQGSTGSKKNIWWWIIFDFLRVIVIQEPIQAWYIDFGTPATWLDKNGGKL